MTTQRRMPFLLRPEKTIEQKGLSASGIAALRPLVFFSDSAKGNTDNLIEIYAQVSSAYRAPTLYERFGDNIFVTPADNLRNERALTNAGGIRASARCFKQLVCSLRSDVAHRCERLYSVYAKFRAHTHCGECFECADTRHRK